MRPRPIAPLSALILGLALSGGAVAADESAADSALHELATADGLRLSRASLCGYEEDDLGRLAAQLRVRADARARELGRSVDDERYGDGMYAGMDRSMNELLKLPPDEIADKHSYQTKHCAQVRSEIDALLRAGG